jgi:F-type H+-transporting ATPase subunit a
MTVASELTASEYIQHHLTFFQRGEGGFWTVNVDTLVVTIVAGLVTFGFMWLMTRKSTAGVPSKKQALVELALEFIDNQVKDIYQGPTKLIAPIALTTGFLVLMLNAMDWRPVDIMAGFYRNVFHIDHWRNTPTADVNTTFALALSVFALSIFYAIKFKGLGGWLHELVSAPFGIKPWWAAILLIPANLAFQLVEYVSKPLSHSLRLFGNMYAGEIIFLLLGALAASSIVGAFAGAVLHFFWAVFHVLIVVLQAYIFMVLTVVYLSMAQEHH